VGYSLAFMWIPEILFTLTRVTLVSSETGECFPHFLFHFLLEIVSHDYSAFTMSPAKRGKVAS
jgi:hypothetical protein